jgi:hypothetical protein
MASIKLQPGTLNPPACYENEQLRFEAFVAKIVATIIGGLQWETQQGAPVDLGIYWLRQNSDGRSRGPRRYNTTDGRWVPWLEMPIIPDSSGGVANAYTATTGHSLVTGSVRLTGRRIVFTAVADNTGACTLDVDGTGAIPIVRDGEDPLESGDIVADALYEVIFNAAGGGRWEMATQIPALAVSTPTYVETPEFAIPAASSFVEVNHSQAKKPFEVRVVAICKTSIDGYAVDDEIDITGMTADVDSGDEDGAAYNVSANTSKITVSANKADQGQLYVARTGGNAAWHTAQANFMLKAYLTFLP